MSLLDLMKTRYSSRQYSDEPVAQHEIDYILEAARVAPTARNNQPFRIAVCTHETYLDELSEVARTFGAPLVMVVCAHQDEQWVRTRDGKPSGDIDATIVTDHMMLAATELGLQSVWVCAFNASAVAEVLRLPESLVPVNLLVIGHGVDTPKSPDRHDRMRRSLEELVYQRPE